MYKKVVNYKYIISKVKDGKVRELKLSDYPPEIISDDMEVMEIKSENNVYMPDVKEHLRIVNRRWREKNNTNVKE